MTAPMPALTPVVDQRNLATAPWIRWFQDVLATFGGLRGELDAEIATRAADDATEAGTRAAADTALDGRLDVLEALTIGARLTALEAAVVALDARLDVIEALFPTSPGASQTVWNDGGVLRVVP